MRSRTLCVFAVVFINVLLTTYAGVVYVTDDDASENTPRTGGIRALQRMRGSARHVQAFEVTQSEQRPKQFQRSPIDDLEVRYKLMLSYPPLLSGPDMLASQQLVPFEIDVTNDVKPYLDPRTPTRMFVAAPEDDRGGGPRSGNVYQYEQGGDGAWTLAEVIKPALSVGGQDFGTSMQVGTKTMLVGAPGVRRVFLFHRIQNTWVNDLNFIGKSTPAVSFGFSIAAKFLLDEETGEETWFMAVGDPAAEGDEGNVYLYYGFEEMTRLVPLNTAGVRAFGQEIALSENVLAVSAPESFANEGLVVLFRREADIEDPYRPTDVWTEVQVLGPQERVVSAFGSSLHIAAAADVLAVGSPRHSEVVDTGGAAYVFSTSDGGYTWEQESILVKYVDARTAPVHGPREQRVFSARELALLRIARAAGATLSWDDGRSLTRDTRATMAKELFGGAVSLDSSGARLFVGASGGNALHVFERSLEEANDWVRVAGVNPGGVSDFGDGVSLGGALIAVTERSNVHTFVVHDDFDVAITVQSQHPALLNDIKNVTITQDTMIPYNVHVAVSGALFDPTPDEHVGVVSHTMFGSLPTITTDVRVNLDVGWATAAYGNALPAFVTSLDTANNDTIVIFAQVDYPLLLSSGNVLDSPTGEDSPALYMAKYSNEGILLWNTTADSTTGADVSAAKVRVLPSGDAVFTGSFQTPAAQGASPFAFGVRSVDQWSGSYAHEAARINMTGAREAFVTVLDGDTGRARWIASTSHTSQFHNTAADEIAVDGVAGDMYVAFRQTGDSRFPARLVLVDGVGTTHVRDDAEDLLLDGTTFLVRFGTESGGAVEWIKRMQGVTRVHALHVLANHDVLVSGIVEGTAVLLNGTQEAGWKFYARSDERPDTILATIAPDGMNKDIKVFSPANATDASIRFEVFTDNVETGTIYIAGHVLGTVAWSPVVESINATYTPVWSPFLASERFVNASEGAGERENLFLMHTGQDMEPTVLSRWVASNASMGACSDASPLRSCLDMDVDELANVWMVAQVEFGNVTITGVRGVQRHIEEPPTRGRAYVVKYSQFGDLMSVEALGRVTASSLRTTSEHGAVFVGGTFDPPFTFFQAITDPLTSLAPTPDGSPASDMLLLKYFRRGANLHFSESPVLMEESIARNISYSVRLASKPTAEVIMQPVAVGNDQVRVVSGAVFFTPFDWDEPHTVNLTFTGVDNIYSGDEQSAVVEHHMYSDDDDYRGLMIQVTVLVQDFDIDPKSCWEILERGASVGDGMYVIDTDFLGPSPRFRVFCDMTTDGGGWTFGWNLGTNNTDLASTDLWTYRRRSPNLFTDVYAVGMDSFEVNARTEFRLACTELNTGGGAPVNRTMFIKGLDPSEPIFYPDGGTVHTTDHIVCAADYTYSRHVGVRGECFRLNEDGHRFYTYPSPQPKMVWGLGGTADGAPYTLRHCQTLRALDGAATFNPGQMWFRTPLVGDRVQSPGRSCQEIKRERTLLALAPPDTGYYWLHPELSLAEQTPTQSPFLGWCDMDSDADDAVAWTMMAHYRAHLLMPGFNVSLNQAATMTGEVAIDQAPQLFTRWGHVAYKRFATDSLLRLECDERVEYVDSTLLPSWDADTYGTYGDERWMVMGDETYSRDEPALCGTRVVDGSLARPTRGVAVCSGPAFVSSLNATRLAVQFTHNTTQLMCDGAAHLAYGEEVATVRMWVNAPGCVRGCHGNGECDASSVCRCGRGWVGEYCDVVEGALRFVSPLQAQGYLRLDTFSGLAESAAWTFETRVRSDTTERHHLLRVRDPANGHTVRMEFHTALEERFHYETVTALEYVATWNASQVAPDFVPPPNVLAAPDAVLGNTTGWELRNVTRDVLRRVTVIEVAKPGAILLEVRMNRDSDGNSTTVRGVVHPPPGGADVADGRWHHIAWTVDNACDGTMHFFLDGVEATLHNHTHVPALVCSPALAWGSDVAVVVGGKSDGASVVPSFEGAVDNLRFWARALPPADVEYARGVAAIGADHKAALMRAWPFTLGPDFLASDGVLATRPPPVLVAATPDCDALRGVTSGCTVVVRPLRVDLLEGPTSFAYNVTLGGVPENDVYVRLDVQPGKYTTLVSPSADLPLLVFTAFDWNVPQTVTLSLPTDDNQATGVNTETVRHHVSSSDQLYGGSVVEKVIVLTDNDLPEIILSKTSANVIEEETTVVEYYVHLSTRPFSIVNVTVSFSSELQAQAIINDISFNATNFMVPRLMRIRVLDDVVEEGDHIIRAIHTGVIIDPEDREYDGLTAELAMHVEEDDEGVSGIDLSPEAISVNEGSLVQYRVRLRSPPLHPVHMVVRVEDEDLRVNSVLEFPITFTRAAGLNEWSLFRTTLVQAVNNDIVRGNIVPTVVHLTESDDPFYNGLEVRLPVTIFENDLSPAVQSVLPVAGSVHGNTDVVLHTADMSGYVDTSVAGWEVFVDGQKCANLTVRMGENTLTCRTTNTDASAGKDRAVVLWINGIGGPSNNLWEWLSDPVILSVVPQYGDVAGGEALTVSGFFFGPIVGHPSQEVLIDGVPCLGLTQIVSSPQDKLTCTSAGSQGGSGYSRSVTTVIDSVPSATNTLWDWYDEPVVDTIEPASGRVTGGTRVTLRGKFFGADKSISRSIRIDGEPCVDIFKVPGEDTMECTVTNARGRTGARRPVIVSVNGWTNDANAYLLWTWLEVPVVTRVQPSAGRYTGGTVITIEVSHVGDFFNPPERSVSVDGLPCVDIGKVVGESKLRCTTTRDIVVAPATRTGVNVRVVVDGVASPTNTLFAWLAPPIVFSVEPRAGRADGGTLLTVRGENFAFSSDAPAQVAYVDGVPCVSTVPHVTDFVDTVICETPPTTNQLAVSRTVSLDVDGQSSDPQLLFSYLGAPEVLSVKPIAGTLLGGSAVTIEVRNLGPDLLGPVVRVFIGNVECINAHKVFGQDRIECTTEESRRRGMMVHAPLPRAVAAVRVLVDGVEPYIAPDTVLPAFEFLQRPVVTRVEPLSGSTRGGTYMTVEGANFGPDEGGPELVVFVDGVKCLDVVKEPGADVLRCMTDRAEQWRKGRSVDVQVDRVPNEPNSLWTWIPVFFPPVLPDVAPCNESLDCTQCMLNFECGWCASTSTCMDGDRDGPTINVCDHWRFNSCPDKTAEVASWLFGSLVMVLMVLAMLTSGLSNFNAAKGDRWGGGTWRNGLPSEVAFVGSKAGSKLWLLVEFMQMSTSTIMVAALFPANYAVWVNKLAWLHLFFTNHLLRTETDKENIGVPQPVPPDGYDGPIPDDPIVEARGGARSLLNLTQYGRSIGMEDEDLFLSTLFYFSVITVALVLPLLVLRVLRYWMMTSVDVEEDDPKLARLHRRVSRATNAITGITVRFLWFGYYGLLCATGYYLSLLDEDRNATHQVIYSMAWLVVVFVGLGVPVALFFTLASYKYKLNERKTYLRFGSIYGDFKPSEAYWGILQIGRRGMRAVLTGMLQRYGTTQIVLIMLLEAVYVVFLQVRRPYLNTSNHVTDTMFSLVHFVQLSITAAFVAEVSWEYEGWGAISLQMFCILFAIIMFMWDWVVILRYLFRRIVDNNHDRLNITLDKMVYFISPKDAARNRKRKMVEIELKKNIFTSKVIFPTHKSAAEGLRLPDVDVFRTLPHVEKVMAVFYKYDGDGDGVLNDAECEGMLYDVRGYVDDGDVMELVTKYAEPGVRGLYFSEFYHFWTGKTLDEEMKAVMEARREQLLTSQLPAEDEIGVNAGSDSEEYDDDDDYDMPMYGAEAGRSRAYSFGSDAAEYAERDKKYSFASDSSDNSRPRGLSVASSGSDGRPRGLSMASSDGRPRGLSMASSEGEMHTQHHAPTPPLDGYVPGAASAAARAQRMSMQHGHRDGDAYGQAYERGYGQGYEHQEAQGYGVGAYARDDTYSMHGHAQSAGAWDSSPYDHPPQQQGYGQEPNHSAYF